MARAPVAAIFPGHAADGSFMQQGHDGARAACAARGLELRVTDRVTLPALEEALTAAATAGAGLILAQGGQCEAATRLVAPRFPAVRFVVVQGHSTAANLYAYRAAQEQSAFLAGAAAGLMTETGVVGHVSGIRPRPGLLARAAFAAGIAHVAPEVRLLSVFTGDQDDAALAAAAAERLAEAGARLVFTMLNAAQAAVMQVARRRGIALAGDGHDWVAAHPGLFRLAAIADTGGVMEAAIADFAEGRRPVGEEVVFGLSTPAIVRLVCGEAVPAAVQAVVAAIAEAMREGRVEVTDKVVVEELPL
jgi:basic membrane protein A